MELIYYMMKLEFVAMPAGEQAVSRWSGEQTLIVSKPRGDMHSDRLYCHQLFEVRVRISNEATLQLWSPQIT